MYAQAPDDYQLFERLAQLPPTVHPERNLILRPNTRQNVHYKSLENLKFTTLFNSKIIQWFSNISHI